MSPDGDRGAQPEGESPSRAPLAVHLSSWLFPPRTPTYGTVYGMRKTTVYLPDDLKRELERVAAARGCSEAELIREAVRTLAGEAVSRRPRLPLFKSGKRGLAERIDRALAGFGER